MSVLSIDQIVTLTEVLVLLLGVAITWAVFYGSENAELPGESKIPDPMVPDDMVIDARGRSLR
jgi:hypothetical protein